MTNSLDLAARDGLPDALRVLIAEFPRDDWSGHANFGELVQFWMERHVMFRELATQIRTQAEAALEGQTDTKRYAAELSRFGGFFLNQLHAHHQIEDNHYFPQLIGLDGRIARGFEILDADHHALHDLLDGFAGAANAVLGQISNGAAARDQIADFHHSIGDLERLLARHLEDEEDLIVPVILKTGFHGG